MKMRTLVEQNPLLAILRGVPDDILLDYVSAIMDGGVHFFEVALNSPSALAQISRLRKTFGNTAHIGAGTATTVDRAKSALKAGAEFLLSPSSDEDVLAYCAQENIAMMPGALTPSEISLCMRYGFYTIKLFPASAMPMNYAAQLKSPLDGTEYVAIGGVTQENLTQFLQNGYLGVGLGSNILPKSAVAAKDWSAAAAYVASLTEKIHNMRCTE